MPEMALTQGPILGFLWDSLAIPGAHLPSLAQEAAVGVTQETVPLCEAYAEDHV